MELQMPKKIFVSLSVAKFCKAQCCCWSVMRLQSTVTSISDLFSFTLLVTEIIWCHCKKYQRLCLLKALDIQYWLLNIYPEIQEILVRMLMVRQFWFD